MAGGEKKRQHYVPQFYLKAFSADDSEPYNLFCYDMTEKSLFRSSTRNIAQSSNFYDLSEEQALENLFEDMEREFAKVHEKIIQSKRISTLSRDEKYVMAHFLSHQYIRTRKFRDVVKQASEHTLEVVDEEEGDEKARRAVEAGTTDEGAKHWHAQLMSNALKGFADLLIQMKWFLFVNETDYALWTSDHPVAIFNPINPEPDPEKGIKKRGTKVHVPLSNDIVLALYDPREYFVKSECEELTEKQHVDFQNKLQVEHSHRQVYSADDDLALAEDLVEENPEYADLDYSDDFPDHHSYE